MLIARKIRDNELIKRAWNVLSRSIANETFINSIKKNMITKWIDIRAKSFVNAYIQVLKLRKIAIHQMVELNWQLHSFFCKKTIFLSEPQFS